MTKLEAVGKNLLPAIAYGDAAGLTAETRSAAWIAEHHGRIDRLLPIDNKFMGQLPAGSWSDDTVLSLAIAESLVEKGDFDLDHIAYNHLVAYVEQPNSGFGGSTRKALSRLAGGTPPAVSGEIGAPGNGILMKMAPLVYWQEAKNLSCDIRIKQIGELTLMTHNSPVALATAQTHTEILEDLIKAKPGEELSGLWDNAIEASRFYEKVYGAEAETSELLLALSQRRFLSTADILEITDGKGFYVPQTVAMAYGAFMIKHSFPESVFDAINLGGDTDSTGSIVAAMTAMYHGELNFPDDYRSIQQRQRLEKVSGQLAALVSSQGK